MEVENAEEKENDEDNLYSYFPSTHGGSFEWVTDGNEAFDGDRDDEPHGGITDQVVSQRGEFAADAGVGSDRAILEFLQPHLQQSRGENDCIQHRQHGQVNVG